MKTPGDDHANPTDELQKQAWVWLRLLNSGKAKPWDVEGFQRWLQAHPAHKAAFNTAKQQWATFGPVAGAVLRRSPEAAAFHERTQHRRLRSRRAFLGAAVGAAAVAGIAVLHPPADLWPAPGEWGADYRTAVGEQREVILADQVKVTLNTQTRIRRQLVSAASWWATRPSASTC
jgi:transmembrane sensor